MSRNPNPRLVFSICIFKSFFIKKLFKKLFFEFFLKNLTERYRRSKIRIWCGSLIISVIPFSERKGYIAENILNSFSAQANQNRIQRSNFKRLKSCRTFVSNYPIMLFRLGLQSMRYFRYAALDQSGFFGLGVQLIRSWATVTLVNQMLGSRR
jgi:hypothetical protein